MDFDILPARGEAEIAEIRTLRREYANWLGVAHIFDELEAELALLPGRYAPPAGELLLARGRDAAPLGCIGVRPFARAGACEIKHLYVRGERRGGGVGAALVAAAVRSAVASGYREALLDVLPSMASALSIYRALGFEQTPPYWPNTVSGALFFAKRLQT